MCSGCRKDWRSWTRLRTSFEIELRTLEHKLSDMGSSLLPEGDILRTSLLTLEHQTTSRVNFCNEIVTRYPYAVSCQIVARDPICVSCHNFIKNLHSWKQIRLPTINYERLLKDVFIAFYFNLNVFMLDIMNFSKNMSWLCPRWDKKR